MLHPMKLDSIGGSPNKILFHLHPPLFFGSKTHRQFFEDTPGQFVILLSKSLCLSKNVLVYLINTSMLLGKTASFKGHLLFINITVIMHFTKVCKFCVNSRCRQGLFLRPIRTEPFVGAHLH